ncbi:MAG: glycosyltransferase [Chthoniobacterales bacterium]
MLRILVLTTDLPYFPGKHGVDFFNLRYLARENNLGVVGPLHPFFPAEGIKNLESFLVGSYFWPRPVEAVTLPPHENYPGRLRRWLRNWNVARRKSLLLRLLKLDDQPDDAYLQLAVLANCAPHFLAALAEQPWQAAVLIQSNTAPWLRYLPAHLPKTVYFHDVRTHFAARQAVVQRSRDEAAAAARQERQVCREADVVGFVSRLDEQRAVSLLQPTAYTGVAPIPMDTEYYLPAPRGWERDPRSVVLFTGHLSHPPNVDAVLYFLREIWPLVRKRCAAAFFQVAGALPAPALVEACAAAGTSVELHPNVPDIRPFFWNAAAYVVPMRFGGGVRQKIFESWLMRVPLVCTTMAAEGILAEHERNCWLEDTPVAFADRVAEVLEGKVPPHLLECAAGTVLANNTVEIGGRGFEQLIQQSVHLRRRRPFKLLYDLRWMEIGKAGGLEQLAYEQLDAISKVDRENSYRALCPRSTYSEWRFPKGFRCRGIFHEANETRGEALHAAVVNALGTGLQWPPVLNPQMRAMRFYNRLDFDLVHSVNSYIHPDLASFPQILTMCDLQHIHFPDFFSPEDWKTREHLYRSSSESARHIICISEYTRQDLHKQYRIPLNKITTVWVIPSRSAWLQLDAARSRRLLGRMGLNPSRFLYFPAHPWAHKNHRRLLEAFSLIVDELPQDIRLVLTGSPFTPDHPARALLADERLRTRVVHLGYRSPVEVRALYAGALGLVFPSLFEGFGMPVAEAIIAGCPVACSNTTSLPEIAGDAALTFDPESVTKMARAILRLATDQSTRIDLVRAGERRRPLFSSRLPAVKTLAIYRRVFDEIFSEQGDCA